MRMSLATRRLHACVSLLVATMLVPGPMWAQGDPQKFMEEDIDFVLQRYEKLTELTMLRHPTIGADLRKKITFRPQKALTEEEYIDAVENLLSANGIALVPYRDKFVWAVRAADAIRLAAKIGKPGDKDLGMPAERGKLDTRVVLLKHMEAQEAISVIQGLKSHNGQIQKVDRVNGIIISDKSINVRRMLEILDHIDLPIEVREKLHVFKIRHTKPSLIKTKIEAIVADLRPTKKPQPAVARPRSSGPPHVIRALPPSRRVAAAVPAVELEKGMIRGKVKIIADDRTGVLIFITQPSNMEIFGQIIQALDIETGPDVTVRVFRLEFADADTIAGMLNKLIGAKPKDAAVSGAPKTDGDSRGATLREYVARRREDMSAPQKSKLGELSAQNVKILPDKRTNALIVMGSPSDLAAIAEIISDMDMMLSQVLVEAVIIEVKLSDSTKTGFDWLQRSMAAYSKDKSGKRAPVFSFAGRGGGGTLSPSDATTTPSFPSGGGLTYYFTHFGLNMDAVFSMVREDERTRVLSTPVIVTTDNTEATITATEEIYVSSGTTVDQHGTAHPDYKVKSVGLELTVKPHINTNKVVMMEIAQTMSEPGDIGEPESGSRVSSTRTIKAFVSVKNRETIILGGQVRETSVREQRKIPILGDIPLAGRLFSHTSDSKGRTEMIVFITPYVLDSPSDIEKESRRRKDALDLKGVWKKGWTDSELAEPTDKEKRRLAKLRRSREKALGRAVGKLRDETRNSERELTEEITAPRLEDLGRELFQRETIRWRKTAEKIDEATAPRML